MSDRWSRFGPKFVFCINQTNLSEYRSRNRGKSRRKNSQGTHMRLQWPLLDDRGILEQETVALLERSQGGWRKKGKMARKSYKNAAELQVLAHL